MKVIKGKVVAYSEIPKKLIPEWLRMYKATLHCYVEVHIDDLDDDHDELSIWLKKEYPDIEKETFYIEIDY